MGSYTSFGSGSKESSIRYESTGSTYSPLRQVVDLLEELDASKAEVARKERELEIAKNNMNSVTSKVQTKLGNLDPNTIELVRGMLNQIDGKTNSFMDEETKGRGLR